ncbi:hypothetical protein IU11_19510 [Cellulosimicrobium sp. MM]|nr:hypothetical protein [Cellulosimicrobium sp. MM]KFD42605.1 hypothetical protein IU11_19510 [Cellulosimicrobium sp. MM]
MVFTVDVDGYQGAEGTSARITVDLSRVTGTTRSWPWAEGTVRMYNGVVDSWDAPLVTFTTHEWHPSPFQGQFTVGA